MGLPVERGALSNGSANQSFEGKPLCGIIRAGIDLSKKVFVPDGLDARWTRVDRAARISEINGVGLICRIDFSTPGPNNPSRLSPCASACYIEAPGEGTKNEYQGRHAGWTLD